MSISRRAFARFALGGAAGVGLSVAGWRASRLATRVETFDVPLTALPEGFDGFRIAVVADVHAGPHMSIERMEEAALLAGSLDGDVVVLIGDMVDEGASDADMRDFVAVFRGLEAPHGVVAVPGNHEHLAGIERVARALEGTEIRLLRDEEHTIRGADGGLALLGVDDPAIRPFDPPQDAAVSAASSRAPRGLMPILLAHRPAAFEAAAVHRIPLTLSGHTHAGQIGLPVWDLTPMRFLTKYIHGHFRRGDCHLVVSAGIGASAPLPIRVGIAPAVTLVRLVAGASEGHLSGADETTHLGAS